MISIIIFFLALFLILLMTARFKVHPFLSLITVSLFIGVIAGEPFKALESISTGMGKVFANLAIIIVSGSIIGKLLEETGATSIIAEDILRISKKPLLSLSLLGFLTAVPVMCSILAFVIFIPIAREIGYRLRLPSSTIAMSLGLGTLASFNLIYPSPGVYSAVNELGASTANVFIIGLIIAIPTMLIGYLYVDRFCRSGKLSVRTETQQKHVNRLGAYVPIAVPVMLISSKIFFPAPVLSFLGDPNVALLIGVLLAVIFAHSVGSGTISACAEKGIKRGGIVLLDLCGGGALGTTLEMTGVGFEIGQVFIHSNLPVIFIPFLVAVAIQTVQGSRVVTMLIAPSLIVTSLPELGLPVEIALISMACGTFMISHANDPYFWTIVEMADLDPATGYRCYTLGGIVMGATAFILVAAFYSVFY
ncbi:MAG: GntP family permease [Methanosarcinaceae archaeon]|nr:GntP family permease [Methanosarcinaceae archaeon]